MRCQACTNGVLIEIRMRVRDHDLVFRRCGSCDARFWEDTEGAVPLSRVLDLARSA